MFNKDGKLDFNTNPHSPHTIIFNLIKKGSSVLDVGCNTGYIGKYLVRQKGCVVDGIDLEISFLDQAKACGYRNLFQVDLSAGSFCLTDERYDYIVFADILEHLPDPAKALAGFTCRLKEGASIIISLPNIARLEYRLKLLMGRFDYEESGILHQDHLRFFTKASAAKMIRHCGLTISEVIPTGLGHMLNFMTNLTAFQFIFICKKP